LGEYSLLCGESVRYAFPDSDGVLYDDIAQQRGQEERYVQTEGAGHSFIGLREDGCVVVFAGDACRNAEQWTNIKSISIGKRDDQVFLAGISE